MRPGAAANSRMHHDRPRGQRRRRRQHTPLSLADAAADGSAAITAMAIGDIAAVFADQVLRHRTLSAGLRPGRGKVGGRRRPIAALLFSACSLLFPAKRKRAVSIGRALHSLFPAAGERDGGTLTTHSAQAVLRTQTQLSQLCV